MRLQLVARGMNLSEALSDYVDKKIYRLERLSTRIVRGELVLQRECGRIKGELILRVKKGVLVVRAEGGDIHNVIDLLRNRMAMRLRRYEARWNPRARRRP